MCEVKKAAEILALCYWSLVCSWGASESRLTIIQE